MWLQVDPDSLRLLAAAERAGLVHPGWSPVLAEASTRLDTTPPNTEPTARLPAAALRRWVHIRDRRCTFPGCRDPAHRSDIDHTVEHAHGGATVDADLAAACRHDHRPRHDGGWTLTQPTPGNLT